MKKFWRIALIVVGLLVLAGAAFVGYIMLTTKSHSPFAEVTHQSGDLNLRLTYCQPYKKGRTIFGAGDEALQPYGKYWRLGANEATEISFSRDVTFGDAAVPAGQYVLYAVPGPDRWTLGLNTDLGRWGAREVDHDLDVVQVSVPVQPTDSPYEQLTMRFAGADSTLALEIAWDNVMVAVPIR